LVKNLTIYFFLNVNFVQPCFKVSFSWTTFSTIRNKNCPWWPYLLAEWDEMKFFCRGPYIDAFCQDWFHLVQLFQRSRLKYEKLLMLKKSSPLKLIGQMEPNLAGSIYVRSSIKLLHLVPFGQQTWPLLLKIEHIWQAEHVVSLHLTSISYIFWNKKRKVLKFWWKRAITPKWVMGFTLKLQGR
jgi:hypothetical protein